MESARTVGNVKIGAVSCLDFSIRGSDVAPEVVRIVRLASRATNAV